MKKTNLVLLLIISSIWIISCQKEEKSPDPMVLYYETENVSLFGGSDGSIDLTITGGTPPYSFAWSNNQYTEDIDSLIAGTYIVNITDQNNDILTDTFFITQPTPNPLILTITGHNVTIYNGNDGSASATVSGGVAPYSYIWSNGLTQDFISGLVAGNYKFTVTDNIGTIKIDSIFISQPNPGPQEDSLFLDYNINEPTVTGSSDGSIDISVSGGYPPYNYSWSNGSKLEDQINLSAGSYSVTVQDQNSQSHTAIIVLSDVVTDIDGNVYSKIRIGEQIWMKENLKVTHNTENIPVVSYVYGNDNNNIEKYGRLYTWDVAMNGSVIEMAQGICPCGWHIPSDNEFKTLEIYLGMSQSDADLENTWRGDGIGTSLIVGGNSGYDAQLSGRMDSPGVYNFQGRIEYMWTSTEYDNDFAWRRCLDLNSIQIGRWNTFPKTYGFSVRCLKDN